MRCYIPFFFFPFFHFDTPKREKNARKLNLLSISHYASGKNGSLFGFSCVFAHKPYQNATPTHGVIWALASGKIYLFFYFYFLNTDILLNNEFPVMVFHTGATNIHTGDSYFI